MVILFNPHLREALGIFCKSVVWLPFLSIFPTIKSTLLLMRWVRYNMSKFWYVVGVVFAAGIVAASVRPSVVKNRAIRDFRNYYGLPK